MKLLIVMLLLVATPAFGFFGERCEYNSEDIRKEYLQCLNSEIQRSVMTLNPADECADKAMFTCSVYLDMYEQLVNDGCSEFFNKKIDRAKTDATMRNNVFNAITNYRWNYKY